VVTWTAPTATDNSGSAFVVYSSHTSGSSFPVGVTTPVTYVFSDPSSNYAVCTFFVTISTTVVDNTPPVISNCPANRAVTAAVGATSAAVSWVEPTATDNSGSTVSRVSNFSPGDSFNLGSTTVTYTFTDVSGNDNTCSFVVTVNPGQVVDNTPPVISNCPPNQAVTAAVGASSAVVTWVEPTATDDSGLAVSRVSTAFSGSSFNLGPTTVTYTFTDAFGNDAICSFVVTVNRKIVTTHSF
jgi:alpha-D-ribose 1-methylphosphonate 5-triphosphate synthase subunit PhnG